MSTDNDVRAGEDEPVNTVRAVPRVTISRVDEEVEHEITRADLMDLLVGLPLPTTTAALVAHAEANRDRVANAGDALAILRRLDEGTYADYRAVVRAIDRVR